MEPLEWKPALEVGVAEIDADHRVLVELLNRMQAACGREDRDEAIAVLEELERYTHYHFSLEDRLMAECAYEFAAEHAREHRELFYEVKHQIDDLLDGERTLGEVAQFMQRWLLRHIAGADRLLAEAIVRWRAAKDAEAAGR